jgi:hypothetical protein
MSRWWIASTTIPRERLIVIDSPPATVRMT